MVKIFFLFDEFSEEAKLLAKNCAARLNKLECESYFSCRPLSKSEIISADYMFIVLTKKCDPYSAFLNDGYRYFLDEITWKRKEDGEIIVLAPDGFEERKLPYRLREKKIFSFSNLAKLEDYLTQEEEPIVKKKNAIEAPAQIKVTTKIAPIIQPKYSPKKIETPGFVNKKTVSKPSGDASGEVKKRNTSACKDDHIFPGYGDSGSNGIYEKKSYEETKRIDKEIYCTNKKNVNSTYKKDYKRNNKSVDNKSGCTIFFIIGFFLVLLAAIIFAVVSLASSNEGVVIMIQNAAVYLPKIFNSGGMECLSSFSEFAASIAV